MLSSDPAVVGLNLISRNLHPKKDVCTSADTAAVILWLDYLMLWQTADHLISPFRG